MRADHVAVKRWLDGTIRQPQLRTCRLITRALSEKIGRPVSLSDIGYGHLAASDIETDIRYPTEMSDSVTALGLLTSEQFRSARSGSTLIVAPEVWDSVVIRWLMDSDEEPSLRLSGPSAVTEVDVDAVREATVMFRSFDYRFGGGRPKLLVVNYLEYEVLPLLRHLDLSNPMGKRYLGEVAFLAGLAAWTSYDTGGHGLAQRYFIHAFRMAKEAGERALCGRLLCGMSHQANFLGHYQRAVDLARAAQHGAEGHTTPTAMALFRAMEARGLASLGDEKSVTRVLLSAERWHAQSRPENDPFWVQQFDSAEMHAEFAHCFRDLGLPDLARDHATATIRESSPIYLRNLAFGRMVLATAHLLSSELHRALTVAREVIDAAAALRSLRVWAYLDDFKKRLSPYVGQREVRAFSEYLAGHRPSECPPATG